jgi:GNAT superfamily N-acetyltransferase
VLIEEYLRWVAAVAKESYGLTFDVDAMVESDIEDASKFYPPQGRFYLVVHEGEYVGVGCLKRLATGIGEVQRMYVRPHIRGVGAGRALVERLVEDARGLGYKSLRLESLKALTAAHNLYRSMGFKEIDPYSENSMKQYQAPETLAAYRESAVFMEMSVHGEPS